MSKYLKMILVLCFFVGCSSTTKTESTGQYIDSAAITAKVKAQLVKDKNVSALDVSVETYKGVVLLSGFVKTDKEKEVAEELAEKVSGVKRVRNELKIRE